MLPLLQRVLEHALHGHAPWFIGRGLRADQGLLEHFLARHFTVGQQVGALGHGDRQRVMPQRLAYPARPLPGNRRQGEVEAVVRQLRASTGICPAGQDGMSLRLFGTLQGEHVGELGRHPFAEDGHANFGGDVTRFHVQLPPGGELVATDLEAVE